MFLPMNADVCKPPQRLISFKAVLVWNRTYQEIYERAKFLVKEDACMKYYDVWKPLHLETDASGVGLGVTLLQVMDNLNCRNDEAQDNAMLQPTAFVWKSLSSVAWWYSNIEREALRNLHVLVKFYHYSFACEVHIITDHKSLVSIMGKDVAILSQCLQHIILHIHQYRVHIIYKPGPEIFIADWVSHYNHEENKDGDMWPKHKCQHYHHSSGPASVHP